MKKNITTLLVAASATLLVGCSTAPVVKYGDAKSVETVTTDFGSTDLQQIAESMARSLLESPVVLGSREPPFVTVADIKNRTSEYIDTKAIGGKIRSQLTRSGKVRFVVSIAEMQAQVDELKFAEVAVNFWSSSLQAAFTFSKVVSDGRPKST